MFKLKENIKLSFNGRTQREVAEQIGITEFTLSKILNKRK